MATPTDRPLTLKQERFVDALPLANSLTEAAIKAGYSNVSGGAHVMAYDNLHNPTVIAAIADRKEALQAHVARAQALFAEHTQQIATAMVDRAEGEGRDSQRAGERILETVGVLQREPLVVVRDPSLDVLAKLTAMMALQLQAQAEAEDAPLPSIEAEVRDVLGTG